MKVLICGSRVFEDKALMAEAFSHIENHPDVSDTENIIIIHGNAKGADSMAGNLATQRRWWVWPCSAKWEVHGKSAGPIRNQIMLDQSKPSLALAFPTTTSKGTYDMINRLIKAGVTVWIFTRGPNNDPQVEVR